jgi:hypothetical protein
MISFRDTYIAQRINMVEANPIPRPKTLQIATESFLSLFTETQQSVITQAIDINEFYRTVNEKIALPSDEPATDTENAIAEQIIEKLRKQTQKRTLMLSYRQISEILKSGYMAIPFFFYERSAGLDCSNNFNVNQYGTTNSDISGNPDFYGYNPNSSKTIQEQYSYDEVTKFSDPRLLGDAVNSFADIVQKIDFGGNLEKSKLKFTSIPQGVFNFGLASKGLFRPIEYYSVEEKKDN